MTELLCLVIGLLAGYEAHRLEFLLKHIKSLVEPKNEPGVTYGAERPINEYSGAIQDSTSIVEPKSPQLIAWEAEQSLNKEQVRLRPK